MTQDLFKVASNEYELSLNGAYKQENGIFYTDISLAEKIINNLPKPEKTAVILDPCCGTGNFLFAAKKHGYNNIYGIDVDRSAIELCKKNISGGIYIAADFIGQLSEKTIKELKLQNKADVIIGNPPYVPISGNVTLNTTEADDWLKRKVDSAGKNLFIAALIRSFDFLKEGGLLSYIIPKNFLHVSSYSALRQTLLREKQILSIVDLGACFKNVRGEQIVLTIKNSPPVKGSKINIKKLSNNRFVKMTLIPQCFYSDEILLFNCNEDYAVYNTLTSSYSKLNDLANGYVGRGKSTSANSVSGKELRKFGYKERALPQSGSRIFIQNIYSTESGIIAAFGGALEASQTITIFTDGDEKMCRYVLGILHSRLCNFFLYKYCYNYSRLTMHTDAKYLKKIPLPPQKDGFFNNFDEILSVVTLLENDAYMSKSWFDNIEKLNKIIYEAYGIIDKQAEYIDAETQRFQSKRWIKYE
ncbi:MAG: N-6 DNA methylase [Defluviitaleaceae bacterium]|nr:N-6 DNA methylase [Defluviitaleaceae bacterium]MCL2273506.1 N-6 DNA methylase [Defluviitaleaceae bacterium]